MSMPAILLDTGRTGKFSSCHAESPMGQTSRMTAITLVGAGRIGLPVVGRLIAAGHRVEVVDLRADLQAEVEAVGAQWSGSSLGEVPVDRLLITVLPGSPELREVMLAPSDGSAPVALVHLARGG